MNHCETLVSAITSNDTAAADKAFKRAMYEKITAALDVHRAVLANEVFNGAKTAVAEEKQKEQ